jgi:hypothetical protein
MSRRIRQGLCAASREQGESPASNLLRRGYPAMTESRSRHGIRRFIPLPPWWLWPLALVTDLGTGVWRLITASSNRDAALFFGSMLWPGLLIAAIVLAVAWLGWSLDLE